jgi:hypothetical protein
MSLPIDMILYIKISRTETVEAKHGCGGSCGGYGHSLCEFADAEYSYKVVEASYTH